MRRAIRQCRFFLPRASSLTSTTPSVPLPAHTLNLHEENTEKNDQQSTSPDPNVPQLQNKINLKAVVNTPPPPLDSFGPLSRRQKADLRKHMLKEGYVWLWEKPPSKPMAPGKRNKRRLIRPLHRLEKIEASIPKRDLMLKQHAKKNRSRHKVKEEWLTLTQIVKHRMKDL